MNYADTLEHNAKARREPKNVLRKMEFEKAANGGVVVTHRMSNFEGKEPVHAFGADEGHLLAAHIEKHMGIKVGGQEPQKEADED